MKRDRAKESDGERRDRDGEWERERERERQKVCYVSADALAVGNPTPISYRDCCWVYRPASRSRSDRTEKRKRDRTVIRKTESHREYQLRNTYILSDTQIIINIISSSSCYVQCSSVPVTGATSVYSIRLMVRPGMIPISRMGCVKFAWRIFTDYIQGDCPSMRVPIPFI